MSDRIFINGLCAARLSRRDGARGQGRPELCHRSWISTIDLSDAARSDKVKDTVSYDKVVECASAAFLAQRFRLIEAAAGRVADAVLGRLPARARDRGDDP